MSNYKVQDGQSIYDVSTQLYGGLDNVVQVLKDNPSIESLNDSLSSGQEIAFSNNNEVVSTQFALDGTIVNTSDPKIVGLGDFNLDFNLDFNS